METVPFTLQSLQERAITPFIRLMRNSAAIRTERSGNHQYLSGLRQTGL